MKPTHKEIESPWTHTKYIIRKVDPAIMSMYATPESKETQKLRKKIDDILGDRKSEVEKQEALMQKWKDAGQEIDNSMIEAINASIKIIDEKLATEYAKLNKQLLQESDIIEFRTKIVGIGLVAAVNNGAQQRINIKTQDDYLDLAEDGSFIYANITAMSRAPAKFFEQLNTFFRGEQPGDDKDSDDSKDVQPETKQDN